MVLMQKLAQFDAKAVAFLQYAMTYEPLYLYYPSRRGHSNVFKLIVDALRVEVV